MLPTRWLTMAVLAAVLVAMLVSTATQMANATSGTWDETIYMRLGQQLHAGEWMALTSLGVAPVPVRMAWTSRALEPIASASNDHLVYRQRIMCCR